MLICYVEVPMPHVNLDLITAVGFDMILQGVSLAYFQIDVNFMGSLSESADEFFFSLPLIQEKKKKKKKDCGAFVTGSVPAPSLSVLKGLHSLQFS